MFDAAFNAFYSAMTDGPTGEPIPVCIYCDEEIDTEHEVFGYESAGNPHHGDDDSYWHDKCEPNVEVLS